jgi:hypothetical protein
VKTAEEYREQAQECRRLAKHALTRQEREQLLTMAETWETLATERLRTLRIGDGPRFPQASGELKTGEVEQPSPVRKQ